MNEIHENVMYKQRTLNDLAERLSILHNEISSLKEDTSWNKEYRQKLLDKYADRYEEYKECLNK